MTPANVLTIARALFVVPVAWFIAEGDMAAALVTFLVAAATDALDGPLARCRGEASSLGASLDPLADKVLVVGTLAALAVRGDAPVWAVAVVTARELVAVEIRVRSERGLAATIDGKAKTLLQVSAVAALLVAAGWPAAGLAAAAGALLVAAVALTVLSGVMLVRRAVQ